MIRSRNGTSRATSIETERKHGAGETDKGEAVAARGTLGGKQNEPSTDVASGEATDKKFEKARGHVFNSWRCGDKEKAKTFGKVSSGPTLVNLSFLERVSVSHGTEAKFKKQIEQFLSFADEEELALVADDEVDAAIVLYLNMSCGDGEVLLAGLLFFLPQHGKLGDKNSLGRGEL